MILLAAWASAIVTAWARGGRLGALANAGLRHGWLALLGFGLQLGIIYRPASTPPESWSGPALILVGSYLMLCAFAGLNWARPGIPLMAAGLALNLAVMVANGGYMPVTPEVLGRAGLAHLAMADTSGARVALSKDILLSREATRLWWLSDTLVLGPPLKTAFSVGDLLLAAGTFAFFHISMRCVRINVGAVPAETES